MTSSLKYISQTCIQCHKECEAPRIVMWDPEINEKVKICSDKCLDKYKGIEAALKASKEALKDKKTTIVLSDLIIEDL